MLEDLIFHLGVWKTKEEAHYDEIELCQYCPPLHHLHQGLCIPDIHPITTQYNQPNTKIPIPSRS